jgi:hypothetical protein
LPKVEYRKLSALPTSATDPLVHGVFVISTHRLEPDECLALKEPG